MIEVVFLSVASYYLCVGTSLPSSWKGRNYPSNQKDASKGKTDVEPVPTKNYQDLFHREMLHCEDPKSNWLQTSLVLTAAEIRLLQLSLEKYTCTNCMFVSE